MQPWIRAEMFYNLGFWSLKHTDVLFPNLTDLTCAFNILSTWLQEICYLQEEFTRQKIDLATKLNERERDERDQGKRQTKIFKQTGNDFHYGMAMSEVLQIGTGYAILCLHTRPKPGLRLIFNNVTIYYNEILHNS